MVIYIYVKLKDQTVGKNELVILADDLNVLYKFSPMRLTGEHSYCITVSGYIKEVSLPIKRFEIYNIDEFDSEINTYITLKNVSNDIEYPPFKYLKNIMAKKLLTSNKIDKCRCCMNEWVRPYVKGFTIFTQ